MQPKTGEVDGARQPPPPLSEEATTIEHVAQSSTSLHAATAADDAVHTASSGATSSTPPPRRQQPRRRLPTAALARSPAKAYLSVRQLLAEVERQQLYAAHSLSLSDVKFDFLTYPDPRRHVCSTGAESAATTGAERLNPKESTAGLFLPGDAAEAEKSMTQSTMMRAMQRVHWLARWTQDLLEAYPFVDDSDVETGRSDASPVESLSLTLRATSQEGSKLLLLSGSGRAEKPPCWNQDRNEDHDRDSTESSHHSSSDITANAVVDATHGTAARVKDDDAVAAAEGPADASNASLHDGKPVAGANAAGGVLTSGAMVPAAAPLVVPVHAEDIYANARKPAVAHAASAVESHAQATPEERHESISNNNNNNNAARALSTVAEATDAADARGASDSPPVERQLSYVSEHDAYQPEKPPAAHDTRDADTRAGAALLSLLTLSQPGEAHRSSVDDSTQKDSHRVVENRKRRDAEALEDGREVEPAASMTTSAAPLFGVLTPMPPPPPPIVPRDRPPLCRDVGCAHDIPFTVVEQRAALRRQDCSCAHCGAAIPLPHLSLAARCALGWRAVRRAVSRVRPRRLCCGCGGCRGGASAEEDSGSEGEENENAEGRVRASATPRSASGATRDDSVQRTENRRVMDNSSNNRSTGFFSHRGRSTYVDVASSADDDASTADDEASERRGLLAHSRRATSQGHGHRAGSQQRAPQRAWDEQGRLHTPLPPPAPRNVARRLELNSSLSTAVPAAAAAAAAAAVAAGHRSSVGEVGQQGGLTAPLTSPAAPLTTASVAAISGALYCAYEGVYLCTSCFFARTDVAALRRAEERIVESDAWQPRVGSLQHHDEGNRYGQRSSGGMYAYDERDGEASSVRAAVTQAADRLNRWWMERHFAESSPPPHVPYAEVHAYDNASSPQERGTAHSMLTRNAQPPPPPQLPREPQRSSAAVPCRCILPAHALLRWDFTRYPVSAGAAVLLQQLNACVSPSHLSTPALADVARESNRSVATSASAASSGRSRSSAATPVLYDVSVVHPTLYRTVPALAAAWRLRKKLCLLHGQLWWCVRYRRAVWGVDRADDIGLEECGPAHDGTVRGGTRKRYGDGAPRRSLTTPPPPPPLTASAAAAAAAPADDGTVLSTERRGAADRVQSSDTFDAHSTLKDPPAATASAAAPLFPQHTQKRRQDVAEGKRGQRDRERDAVEAEGDVEANDTGPTAAATHGRRSASPPPPRCAPRRRYLVERAEGWSLLDLYRLTTAPTSQAPTAASSHLSDRAAALAAGHAPNFVAHGESGASSPPLLLVELQLMYAVLQSHLDECDYCRLHCRGTSEQN